jgi:hypothetical protein
VNCKGEVRSELQARNGFVDDMCVRDDSDRLIADTLTQRMLAPMVDVTMLLYGKPPASSSLL